MSNTFVTAFVHLC